MENDNVYDMSSFRSVWARVTAASEKGDEQETCPAENAAEETRGAEDAVDICEVLRGLIDEEYIDAMYYRKLAQRCRRQDFRTKLKRLSAEEMEHFRHLQAAYFIMTGDSCAPGKSCPVLGGVLSSLRLRVLKEREDSSKYIRLSGDADERSLRELLTRLAMSENEHAIVLEKMIAELMR